MGLVYSFNPLGGPVRVGNVSPTPIPTIRDLWGNTWDDIRGTTPEIPWMGDVHRGVYVLGSGDPSGASQLSFIALFGRYNGNDDALLWYGTGYHHPAGSHISPSDYSWTDSLASSSTEVKNCYVKSDGVWRKLASPAHADTLPTYARFYGGSSPEDYSKFIVFIPYLEDSNDTDIKAMCLCLDHLPALGTYTYGNPMRHINLYSGFEILIDWNIEGTNQKVINAYEEFDVGYTVEG